LTLLRYKRLRLELAECQNKFKWHESYRCPISFFRAVYYNGI